MRVLLIQPPHYYGTNSRPPSSFPLGIAYIASALIKAGHSVEALDIYANQYSSEEAEVMLDKLLPVFDFVCISALSTQYRYVKWLTDAIKKRTDRPVVLGNALATFSIEEVFRYTKADICVMGEGEITIVDLLRNLGDLSKVQGISYRENGRILSTRPREYIKDLDTIDFPSRDLFPADVYLKNTCLWSNPEIRTLDIITARGCPYNCNFCSKTFQGVRLRSVENIIGEIEDLRCRYDFGGIKFNDELTLVNKSRTYELCRYLKKAKLSWVCEGRVNLVDADLLKAMKESGCKALGFGVESGSNRILENMNKGITVEQAILDIKATKKVGIEPIIQMMYGYPGEDDKTLEETVDFFKRINCPTMPFSMTTALPGTRLYDTACGNGLIKDTNDYLERLDWGYYAEREVLINFTNFSSADLAEKRKAVESRINLNYRCYLKRNPWIAFKVLFRKARSYYLCNGLLKTVKKIANPAKTLKKDNWMI